MNWRNTQAQYGAVHKTLHWVIALFVLMMLVMGLVMGDIPNMADRFWVYGIHKSLGITILFLMVARLGWKLLNWHRPAPNPTHPWHERVAAEFVHWGFYALLIAMPLSGWILTSAASSTINWFGFFPVPAIVEPNQALRGLASEVHEYIAWGIWAFLGLHVAGALKHAIIDRDNTLRRMLPFTSAAVLLLMAFPALAEDAKAKVWTIDRTQSRLTFEATQEGAPFKGEFKNFDGSIALDPATAIGNAVITIDLSSLDSQNGERDEYGKGRDWLDILTSPTATYKISKFEKAKTEGDYLALGTLVLRGIEKPLDIPFHLTVSKKDGVETARAVGQTTLKRLEFGVGGGDWADDKMVGTALIIRIDVTATARKGK